MGEIFVWVVRQIVYVVESASPDANNVTIRIGYAHLLPDFGFNLYFLIGGLLLKNQCGLQA